MCKFKVLEENDPYTFREIFLCALVSQQQLNQLLLFNIYSGLIIIKIVMLGSRSTIGMGGSRLQVVWPKDRHCGAFGNDADVKLNCTNVAL